MINYKDAKNGLIGHTGFVGNNLSKQKSFPFLYNSQNIDKIKGKDFDLLICSGARGFKWMANKYVTEDYESINKLINCLSYVTVKRFVLISTVDVYYQVDKVNEDTAIQKSKLNPYGKHRRILEEYIVKNFNSTIIRLPGIFGKQMKGGLIHDYIFENFKFLPKEGLVQLYNLDNLWKDISLAINNELNVINFATEPIKITELAEKVFNYKSTKEFSGFVPHYNMQTKYSKIWGNKGFYLYSKKDIVEDIKVLSKKFTISI